MRDGQHELRLYRDYHADGPLSGCRSVDTGHTHSVRTLWGYFREWVKPTFAEPVRIWIAASPVKFSAHPSMVAGDLGCCG